MLVESTTTDIAAKKVSSLLSIRRLQSLPMDGYSPKVGSSSSNQYQYSDLHDDDVVVVPRSLHYCIFQQSSLEEVVACA